MKTVFKNKFLLIIIYLAFISLGLPDTTLGVTWPTMRGTFNLPLEAAGIISMVGMVGTVLSSFLSGHILSKLGTGNVVFFSCVLTGAALFGFSIAPSFGWLLVLAIPLGIGAGAVDTGLNNYVATNYSSRHMSWLHCFWGVGAFFGPNIMNYAIVHLHKWQMGYRLVSMIQLSIAFILFLSLPLWLKRSKETKPSHEEPLAPKTKGLKIFHQKGVLLAIIIFPLYVGAEMGTGLWLGSYLVEGRAIAQITAGFMVAMFFGGITIGRFINGIIADYLSSKTLIRIGIGISLVGGILLNIPVNGFLYPSIILLGLGFAPIFPSLIHETPRRFGKESSEIITGYQVGSAYLSGLLIIPVIGLLASHVSLIIIPLSILFFSLLVLVFTERLNYILK